MEGKIAMLDAHIKRNTQGNLTFSVYQKNTHTDQYLQFASNQPLQHKLGVIRTLYHRCNTICSNENEKQKEVHHLQKVLSVSGYTKSAWVTATKPRANKDNKPHDSTVKKGSITLPYVGHVTDALCRKIRKAGVAVHLKPFNTTRSKLVHPKDKISKLEKSGVVYHIKCGQCDSSYVGETERNLKKRFAEHHRSASPVGHHMADKEHNFSDCELSVLHQETNWFRRGVAEAVHINKSNPDLN